MSERALKNLEVLHAYLITDDATYSGPDALAASIPPVVARLRKLERVCEAARVVGKAEDFDYCPWCCDYGDHERNCPWPDLRAALKDASADV